jgi:tetratricopeptide (TPR) repeat protein
MSTARRLTIAWLLQATLVVLWAREEPSKEVLARQAMDARHFTEARDLYAQLTKDHPSDASYWAARGRVCGYLGDYSAAVQWYDKALTIVPTDVDTLVGKSYVLLWQQDFTSATALLNQARLLAPDSSEVELALAQANFYEQRPKEAANWVKRILLRNPQDEGALELKSRIRGARHLRIELGITGDTLSFGYTGVSGLVDVGLVSPNNFISVHYEDWNRFGKQVVRGGMNFSHTFSHLWTVDASSLEGSRGDVLAHYDNSIGIKHRFHSGWAASTTYRDLLFDVAHIRLVSPSVEYYFERPISLQATYSRGFSVYSSLLPPGQPTNSVLLRYNQSVWKLTLHAGWSKGIELFTIPVLDQIGQFGATTYSAGVDIPTTKVLTSKFEYAFQQRSSGIAEQTYSARLVFQR